MKTSVSSNKILALWLAGSLILPGPAFALRTEQSAHNSGTEELEKAFRSKDPASRLLQLASAALTATSAPPISVPSAIRPELPFAAAGAEEVFRIESSVPLTPQARAHQVQMDRLLLEISSSFLAYRRKSQLQKTDLPQLLGALKEKRQTERGEFSADKLITAVRADMRLIRHRMSSPQAGLGRDLLEEYASEDEIEKYGGSQKTAMLYEVSVLIPGRYQMAVNRLVEHLLVVASEEGAPFRVFDQLVEYAFQAQRVSVPVGRVTKGETPIGQKIPSIDLNRFLVKGTTLISPDGDRWFNVLRASPDQVRAYPIDPRRGGRLTKSPVTLSRADLRGYTHLFLGRAQPPSAGSEEQTVLIVGNSDARMTQIATGISNIKGSRVAPLVLLDQGYGEALRLLGKGRNRALIVYETIPDAVSDEWIRRIKREVPDARIALIHNVASRPSSEEQDYRWQSRQRYVDPLLDEGVVEYAAALEGSMDEVSMGQMLSAIGLPLQQSGTEERPEPSVAVLEGMARINSLFRQAGSDPSALFEAGIHDLRDSFRDSPEIKSFGREGVVPLLLVLPGRLSLPQASVDSSVLKLLVEPKYERDLRKQLGFALTAKMIEITTDPTASGIRVVVGEGDYVQSQKANRLVPEGALFLQVDRSTVRFLTQDFLAIVAAYKPGAVLVVGTETEHADAVALFQSA